MTLLNVSGLELEADGSSLRMGGKPVAYTSRKLAEMRDVLLDADAAEGRGSVETYFMFRSVAAPNMEDLFKEHKVRFDITIIPSMLLGRECNKTVGHYHKEAENGLSFPEVYEVIKGKATFVLQRRMQDAFDVRIIEGKEGDVVLIAPNYGHITVNSGNDRLVLANLVSDVFESEYKGIAEMHGGAVYILADGTHVINRHYSKFSITHFDSPPKTPELEELESQNVYEEFISNPMRFEFLNKPSLLA